MSQPNSEEKPPALFKTWRQFYLFVFGNLVLMIVLFYLFTNMFN